ncbi:hypothetical protein B0T24DRAFT_724223 [Lasiosphaeria ovina]|uniref:Methyltransferase domain-containing protein n=1 Tax=Lasiosphaeria ovina TaxID=92902 RepID=A0AAE0JUR2_9PEZI|nr:hypothetical protein B0T24DRAFT_690952 [Lasiosphaeria ovina]KAK3365372.1 hypothetical protein B0T24DRAFT_724223 [Lasiosphaeria ovina]
MTVASDNKGQYNEMATEYNGYAKLPMAQVEAELIRKALGGGSGSHARQAVKAGARCVDVVDISDSMLQIGRDIEAQSSEESRICWLLADVSMPLADQGIDVPAGQSHIRSVWWILRSSLGDAEIVKEDPGFWKDYLEARSFVVVTARKA